MQAINNEIRGRWQQECLCEEVGGPGLSAGSRCPLSVLMDLSC